MKNLLSLALFFLLALPVFSQDNITAIRFQENSCGLTENSVNELNGFIKDKNPKKGDFLTIAIRPMEGSKYYDEEWIEKTNCKLTELLKYLKAEKKVKAEIKVYYYNDSLEYQHKYKKETGDIIEFFIS